MPRSKAWTAREELILEQARDSGGHWRDAVHRLPNRTIQSISAKWAYLHENGPSRTDCDEDDSQEARYWAFRRQDDAFQAALRHAILTGLETMPEVPVPQSEFRPVVFFPEPQGSGCSSAAAACSDIGEPDSTEARFNERLPDPRHFPHKRTSPMWT